MCRKEKKMNEKKREKKRVKTKKRMRMRKFPLKKEIFYGRMHSKQSSVTPLMNGIQPTNLR